MLLVSGLTVEVMRDGKHSELRQEYEAVSKWLIASKKSLNTISQLVPETTQVGRLRKTRRDTLS